MLNPTRSSSQIIIMLFAAASLGLGCSGDLDTAPTLNTGAGGSGSTGSGGGVIDVNAVCGDGTCSVGESVFSCAQDCEPSDYAACLLTGCFGELSSCQLASGCYDAMNCLEACGPGEACQATCSEGLGSDAATAFSSVLSCSETAGCAPAEVAAPAPTPAADSCVGRCGVGADEGTLCSCETTCVFAGSCCGDYESVCISGAADAVCGDGRCDASESPANCPADCRQAPDEDTSPDILACLFDSCNSEATACVADATCALVLDCLGACPDKDKDCYVACAQDGGFSPTVLDFGVCLNESGCLDSAGDIAGFCGDAKCRGDETPESCPEDCGSGPVCGDSICTVGEIGTCASDCPEVGDCINESCYPQLETCYFTDGCMTGLECAANCNSAECQGGCYEGLSDGARGALAATLECANTECAEAPSQTGPSCGNGACEGGETAQSCPEDCADEPGGGGGNTGQPGPGGGCGDGYCDATETEDSCEQDCSFDDPGTECAYEQCGVEIDNCVADNGCNTLLTCLNQCGNSQQCAQNCYQNTNQQAINIISQLGDCLDDECGPGGQQGGDEDLPEFNSPEAECIVETCEVGNQCQNNPACIEAINCMAACTDPDCVDDCVDVGGGLENYLENQIQGCAEASCIKLDNGPGDDPGGEEAGCGDGICDESTFEQFWCPQDCGDDEPGDDQPGGDDGPGDNGPGGGGAGDIDPQEILECLEESCPSELEACYATPSCAETADCIQACPAGDQNCLFSCVGFSFDQAIIGLATCGGQAGCVDIGF